MKDIYSNDETQVGSGDSGKIYVIVAFPNAAKDSGPISGPEDVRPAVLNLAKRLGSRIEVNDDGSGLNVIVESIEKLPHETFQLLGGQSCTISSIDPSEYTPGKPLSGSPEEIVDQTRRLPKQIAQFRKTHNQRKQIKQENVIRQARRRVDHLVLSGANPAALNAYIDANLDLILLRNWDAVTVDKNGKERPAGKQPLDYSWRSRIYKIVDLKAKMQEGYNVGAILKAGWVVIDVDYRNMPEGRDTFREFCDKYGVNSDDYPCVETGGGGYHFYCRKPADVPILNAPREFPGLEFKTLGSQVVAAGSVHPCGGAYEWDPFSIVRLKDAPMLPDAALDAIRRPERPPGVDEADWATHTPEQIGRMLGHLDVEDFRDADDWWNLMCSCHFMSGGDAVEEFIAWSTSDPQYADHEMIIRQRWDSLSREGAGGNVITAGTFRMYLKKAGHCDKWAEGEYSESGAPMEDLDQFLRSDAAYYQKLRALNRNYIDTTAQGKSRVGRIQRNPMFGHLEVEFFSRNAIRNELNRYKDSVPGGNGKVKEVGLGSQWLEWPSRRYAGHLVLNPSPDYEPKKDVFNLFQGFAVKPDPDADFSAFLEFVERVICGGNKDQFEYVMNWLAVMVQRPEQPAGAVIAITGPKGVGKSTFGRYAKGLVAPYSKQIIQTEHVTGKFNNQLAGCVCLFLDEAFWSGDRKATNVLKGMITEDSFECEPKGVDPFTVPNFLHIVMVTNDEWIVPADEQDRRYFLPDISSEAGAKFDFSRLFDGKGRPREDILAGLMHHLLNRDVTGWRPNANIPETAALQRQRQITSERDPIRGWWKDILRRGYVVQRDIINHGKVIDVPGWPGTNGKIGPDQKDALEQDLRDYAEDLPYSAKKLSKVEVGQWLKDTFGYDLNKSMKIGGKSRKGWELPPLEQARRDYEQRFKTGAIKWEDG